jgi:hypothetical protein
VKPIVAQPLKTLPALYGTRRFITVFTSALHWLTHINPVQFPSKFSKIHFNIVLQLRLDLPRGLFTSCFPNKILCALIFLQCFLQVKVKLSLYRPWRPLGLREVEVPTFSGIRLTGGFKGCQPCSPAAFIPRNLPGTHFC